MSYQLWFCICRLFAREDSKHVVQIAGLRELQVDSVELLLQVSPSSSSHQSSLGPRQAFSLLLSNSDGSDESRGQQHRLQCSVSDLIIIIIKERLFLHGASEWEVGRVAQRNACQQWFWADSKGCDYILCSHGLRVNGSSLKARVIVLNKILISNTFTWSQNPEN